MTRNFERGGKRGFYDIEMVGGAGDDPHQLAASHRDPRFDEPGSEAKLDPIPRFFIPPGAREEFFHRAERSEFLHARTKSESHFWARKRGDDGIVAKGPATMRTIKIPDRDTTAFDAAKKFAGSGTSVYTRVSAHGKGHSKSHSLSANIAKQTIGLTKLEAQLASDPGNEKVASNIFIKTAFLRRLLLERDGKAKG